MEVTMKVGDIITIKNDAGMLRVHIEKELSMREVTMHVGDDKIPSLTNPRLEYHRGTGWGGHLITLCDEKHEKQTFPFNIYLLHIDGCYDLPRCFLGVCHGSEEDVFETVY
jgi:hypothetical protein